MQFNGPLNFTASPLLAGFKAPFAPPHAESVAAAGAKVPAAAAFALDQPDPSDAQPEDLWPDSRLTALLDPASGGDAVLATPADPITGTSGDDVLSGGGGGDRMFGGGGDDRLFGKSGDDVLFGGSGNDVLTGLDGDDVFAGG
ncbi:MAG TPA: hypothetical protein VES39_10835, partial [Rhodospirillales bacterium]|nr:hypothetical protein [Rhodospirillales bacterium]